MCPILLGRALFSLMLCTTFSTARANLDLNSVNTEISPQVSWPHQSKRGHLCSAPFYIKDADLQGLVLPFFTGSSTAPFWIFSC